MTDRSADSIPLLITNEDKSAHGYPASGERLYALDALRASALLLGVVFHSVLAYVMQPGQWAIGTSETNMPLWWFVHYSHGFRMEVFFLLAGFYACLVIKKRGTASFLRNRAIRIALVFSLLLYPMKLLVSIPWISGGLKTGWMQLPPGAASSNLLQLAIGGFGQESWPNINMGHLWFLYYMIWISALFVAVRWSILKILDTRAASIQQSLERGFFKLFSNWLAPLWIALPVTPVLAMTPRSILDSPDSSFALDPHALFIYGFYFCIGWWLQRRPELLSVFAKRWKPLVSLSVLASSVAFFCELRRLTVGGGAELMWGASFANALTLSLAVLGWIGFFVSIFNKPQPVIRYLSDSSYWVYLIHLPIVIALQVWVSDWNSVIAKVVFINAVTFAITMLSYHWCVRYTWIGKWLNGQRHVRSS